MFIFRQRINQPVDRTVLSWTRKNIAIFRELTSTTWVGTRVHVEMTHVLFLSFIRSEMKRIAVTSCDIFDVEVTENDVKSKHRKGWVSLFVSANERLVAIIQIFKYLLQVNIHYERYECRERRRDFNAKFNDSLPVSPFTITLINESCLLKRLGICPRLINVLFATQKKILKNKPKLLPLCWRNQLRLSSAPSYSPKTWITRVDEIKYC